MPLANIFSPRFGQAAAGAACLLGLLSPARGDDAPPAPLPLPAAIPAERYQPIWARAPFSVASAADDAAQGTWALVGLTQDGDVPLVFLLNRQSQERMTVTKQPNEKGFSVEAVDFNADLLQSSARIKTPAESLTVRFDATLTLVNNPPPQPAVNAPPAPGQAVHSIPGAANPGNPLLMPRRPITRTIIPPPLAAPRPASP